jgi:hypothetical protein
LYGLYKNNNPYLKPKRIYEINTLNVKHFTELIATNAIYNKVATTSDGLAELKTINDGILLLQYKFVERGYLNNNVCQIQNKNTGGFITIKNKNNEYKGEVIMNNHLP